MRAFAQKQNQPQVSLSSSLVRPNLADRHAYPLLHLQRAIDNQAVQRMLHTYAEAPDVGWGAAASPPFGHDLSRIPIHTPTPVSAPIQTKLAINKPGDEYEQEADRISQHVMRMPEPQLRRDCACGGVCPKSHTDQPGQVGVRLQTKGVQASDIGQIAAPPIVHEVLRSPGQPLDLATRAFMEPRFGHDFSRVRVHSGPTAEQSAREVSAHAYTVGYDIVFGKARFAPEMQEGRRLLAHELTHVVQQSESYEIRFEQGNDRRGLSTIPMQRHPAAKVIMRDEAAEPSTLWSEVNDAYHNLSTQIAGINQKSPSPTRSDWVNKLSGSWTQLGAPGQKSDAELKKLRDNLNELKKEIAEERAQAGESWKAIVEEYQEERKASETEDEEWRQDAIKILDDRYADTARSVQIAGAYLTFDDLVPLEHMLKEKKHREYAQVRAERKKEGPGTGSTVATGAGLGAVVTYQGKTLVRLGGEKFYISGTPPKGAWLPKGGTTSVFFIYKKSKPKKMYRLDYDTLKKGPKLGQMGWEHNQDGVAKILDLKVTDHQPAGGWGRAAGTAIRIYKWGGRALFVAGLAGMALDIYYAENKVRAVAKAGGALAGGVAGAKLGAVGGAKFGAKFGWAGAAIGTLAGGLIGGGLGAWGGSKATEYVYDLVAEALETEDDWVILTQDQVEPVPGASGAPSD